MNNEEEMTEEELEAEGDWPEPDDLLGNLPPEIWAQD